MKTKRYRMFGLQDKVQSQSQVTTQSITEVGFKPLLHTVVLVAHKYLNDTLKYWRTSHVFSISVWSVAEVDYVTWINAYLY